MLLGLLVWVERGLDDQPERYIYAAPQRGDTGVGVSLTPPRGSKRANRISGGDTGGGDNDIFSFGIDDGEEENGVEYGAGQGPYLHNLKAHNRSEPPSVYHGVPRE